MAESSLFNPGFLGGGFNWWIGQIADDSTWRDNNLSGKHQDKGTIPGWGKRYKVAIIGLHDQEQEIIRDEELPWAQVMYPVTSGGGQTRASQTANLRQGMFVFGFFLDGQDQQVPVIMGILGNNAQTGLKTQIGQSKRFVPTSGFAEGKNPPPGNAKPKVPDEGKVIVKPKSENQTLECSAPPPNVSINQYGVRADRPLTAEQLADAQSARSQADQQGLTGEARLRFIQQKVSEGIQNRCKLANTPGSPSQPGATIEDAGDAVHLVTASDVKREEKYQEKIPLMKPDDKVGSAIKCIQTVLDNLMQKINKYVNAISSYVDAVSNTISNLSSLIAKAACEIAKYLKIIFDKIMEYVLKLLNKELTKVVAAMPSSMRSMFGDMKEIITELILCLYNKITQGLCALVEGLLNGIIQPEKTEQEARARANNPPDIVTTPNVPICYAEVIVGQVIAYSKDDIDKANNTLLNNINAFIDDMQNQVAGVTASLPDISSLLGGINGNMASALSFENLTLNIFGCELKPNAAVSDYYTFARGGASLPDSQLPFPSVFGGLGNITDQPEPDVSPSAEVPYAEPSRATANVKLTSDARTPDQIISSTLPLA